MTERDPRTRSTSFGADGDAAWGGRRVPNETSAFWLPNRSPIAEAVVASKGQAARLEISQGDREIGSRARFLLFAAPCGAHATWSTIAAPSQSGGGSAPPQILARRTPDLPISL
jgi:hypothetical protein